MEEKAIELELSRFVAAEVDGAARVCDFATADGHAGLTFLFALERERGGAREEYVLRLPPAGVKRRGNTDVYRQAPLLRALHAAGLLVPAVPWARADEAYFGLPFIVMERLPGKTLLVWDPDPAFTRSPQALHPLYLDAATTLAAIHRFDWRARLPDWEAPRALADEIRFWRPIYQRAPEAAWAEAAAEVETRLMASIPEDVPVGLVHGDFQPGNLLYRNGRATGVIDWELAHIGAQALDVGWLLMMADPAMQNENFPAVYPPSPEALLAAYESALGKPVAHPRWFQALAGYRFGSIACLNVKLHRKGQREDPLWERIAPSVPRLFGHAQTLLDR